MYYELSRIRLCSVGPAAARFQDVILDLGDAGAVIPVPEEDLYGLSPRTRRPAPASVVYLENGGGKSVLLKLVFSVLLPGRRPVKGANDPRLLDDFVLAADVAHVVLEWTHALSGRKLVTGKFMAWKHQVVSRNSDNLQEAWYSFRPHERLTLDTLPVAEGDRYLSYEAYRKELDEAQIAEPRLELHRPGNQGAWTEHLGKLGVDVELFRYQRVMNRDEGEAVHAFALDSDGGFVDFFLEAVAQHDGLQDMAGLVARHVHRLARRELLVLERDFVERAIGLLAPVDTAQRALTTARDEHARTSENLRSFAVRVRLRAAEDAARIKELDDEVDRRSGEREDAVHSARQWTATVAQQHTLLAAVDLTAAKKRAQDAATASADSAALEEAWRATSVVAEHQAKVDEAQRVRELVASGEEKARPALAERRRATEQLLHGLEWLARESDVHADAEQGKAEAEEEKERKARSESKAAVEAAAVAQAKAAGIMELVEAARADADAVIKAGLAKDWDTLPQAAEDAARNVVRVYTRIRDAEQRDEELREEREEAQKDLDSARHRAENARARAMLRRTAWDEVLESRRQLESADRLAELLEGEAADLEHDAEALTERLAQTISASEHRLGALHAEEVRDEPTRIALADGLMLPPPALVSEACELLAAERIAAWPGWEYIADYPAHKREQLIATAPHIISGILLNAPEQLARAREILAELEPRPISYIAVATTAALDDSGTAHVGGVGFTLEFNRALHDQEAAERERELIEQRHVERAEQMKVLAEAKSADEALGYELRKWLDRYPVHILRKLRTDAEVAVREAGEAEASVTAHLRRVDALNSQAKKTREERRDAETELGQLEPASRQLTIASEQLARIPLWVEAIQDAEAQGRRRQEDSAKAEAEADGHRRLAEEHRGAVREFRRIAAEARRDQAGLPDTGSNLPGHTPPDQPLDVLRQAYATACVLYDKAEVPGELRRQLVVTESEATAAARPFLELAQPIREKALELLRTAEGSDADSRYQALQAAGRSRTAADHERSEALKDQGKYEGALSRWEEELRNLALAGAQPVPLPHEQQDRRACVAALERAQREQSSANEAERVATRSHQAALRERSLVLESTKTIHLLARTLETIAPDDAAVSHGVAPAPYVGDGEQALDENRRLTDACNAAQHILSQSERHLRDAIGSLIRHAAREDYGVLTTPVRQQMAALTPDRLADEASGWMPDLTARLRSLADDLEQISRHRKLIVDHLKGEVDKALGILRSAQRVSALPRELGDWAEQEFLQFSFEKLPDDLVVSRLGEVVDEAAVGRTRDGRVVQRDGLSLLLQGVHAAVPKGFKVNVLKPDTALRSERVRVSKVRDVFSGGQQLTAAIMLYCTMAALRADKRGRKRERHAGVLFLDNPIGRANADYLLDLQRSVAHALGVQLVYTTGLFDENALGRFPLIIRLRNDADLRAARKYLVVDERIGKALDRLDPPDGTGRLSAARVFTRVTDADGHEKPSPVSPAAGVAKPC